MFKKQKLVAVDLKFKHGRKNTTKVDILYKNECSETVVSFFSEPYNHDGIEQMFKDAPETVWEVEEHEQTN